MARPVYRAASDTDALQIPDLRARLRRGTGQPGDPLLRQPKNSPLIHRLRAELAIKLNRRVVPIEHRPLHSAAPALLRNLRETFKQRAAIPLSAQIRPDKEIFEIKTRPAEPGGEVEKVNREANRFAVLQSQQDF